MTLFLILANYIGALVAVQLLRGDLSEDVNMNFEEIYNAFPARQVGRVPRRYKIRTLTYTFPGFLVRELDRHSFRVCRRGQTFGPDSADLHPHLAVVPVRELCVFRLFLGPNHEIADISSVILLRLFIAVINENFDVVEELKRGKQATDHCVTQRPVAATPVWLRRLNTHRWFRASPKSIAVENLPSNLILPMQKRALCNQVNQHSAAPLRW